MRNSFLFAATATVVTLSVALTLERVGETAAATPKFPWRSAALLVLEEAALATQVRADRLWSEGDEDTAAQVEMFAERMERALAISTQGRQDALIVTATDLAAPCDVASDGPPRRGAPSRVLMNMLTQNENVTTWRLEVALANASGAGNPQIATVQLLGSRMTLPLGGGAAALGFCYDDMLISWRGGGIDSGACGGSGPGGNCDDAGTDVAFQPKRRCDGGTYLARGDRWKCLKRRQRWAIGSNYGYCNPANLTLGCSLDACVQLGTSVASSWCSDELSASWCSDELAAATWCSDELAANSWCSDELAAGWCSDELVAVEAGD